MAGMWSYTLRLLSTFFKKVGRSEREMSRSLRRTSTPQYKIFRGSAKAPDQSKQRSSEVKEFKRDNRKVSEVYNLFPPPFRRHLQVQLYSMLATRQALRLTAQKQVSPSLAASVRSCEFHLFHFQVPLLLSATSRANL